MRTFSIWWLGFLLTLFTYLVLASCSVASHDGEVSGTSNVMQFSEEEIYQSLDSSQQALIDTVFTPEEKTTYLQSVKMNLLIMEYLEVNGDSLKLTLSKENALSKGIPEEYYDQLCLEMKLANSSHLPEASLKIETAKNNMAALKARIEAARSK